MSSPVADMRIPYKVVDGNDIPTDIYLPGMVSSSSSSAQPCPVLIMIHGGAFMLGHAGMNNKDQIQDCLERGWIVLAIEHRLCPGVNLLEGPMIDTRDALTWTQDGGLLKALRENGSDVQVDGQRVMVMGTSSGGHLALATAWDTPKPPLAILDFYGAKHFSDPFWSNPLQNMPPEFYMPLSAEQIAQVYAEKFVLVGGVSLEGQPGISSPEAVQARTAFAMHAIATGNVIPTIYPPSKPSPSLSSSSSSSSSILSSSTLTSTWDLASAVAPVDPMFHVSTKWPPVAIVHGTADSMIPMRLSKEFEAKLRQCGVRTEFIEVEGEPHTFCGKMKKGSRTWETQRKGFDFWQIYWPDLMYDRMGGGFFFKWGLFIFDRK